MTIRVDVGLGGIAVRVELVGHSFSFINMYLF
jgi:hypothetical protein